MPQSIMIAPSILSADPAYLARDVAQVTEAGADYIHIDVMDGQFVPNLTMGPMFVKAIKRHTNLPLDVHLMTETPDHLVPSFIEAGADILTVHAEAVVHLDRTLQLIRTLGAKAGVALVPTTPPHVLDYVMGHLSLILVMSVNPGFGGQSFIPSQLDKIRAIRERITQSGRDIFLAVDGGVNDATAGDIIRAGANFLIAGSAIFGAPPEARAGIIHQLRAA